MSWRTYRVSHDQTHHRTREGQPCYADRFDEVLKFHEPGVAPVLRDGLAWHIRPDGSELYPQRHKRAFGFYDGLAAVDNVDGWHHVAIDGAPAYPQRYQWCGNFQGGRCTVREVDGHYLHIDAVGTPVYTERWRYAGDYRDGVAVTQADDGRSTHIDLDGREVHGHWFVDLDVFHKGYARARDESGWCHVGYDGEPIYERRFASVEPFYNGQARVELLDGAVEVIDEGGRSRARLRPPLRSEFAQLSADMVGFWRTQTIATAVELGVPAALPASTNLVAERCGLTVDGARRLLRAFGELQLLRCDSNTWSLTARGEFLRCDHPQTLADASCEYAGPLRHAWIDLPKALSASSGWSPPDVFGDVAADEVRRDAHHRMLRSYARHDYPQVVEALDIADGVRVVDAGGGLGTLAEMLLKQRPSLTVTVLDRPEVVAIGRRQSGDSRIQWMPANLFGRWGIEADVVILSRVLHDWDDTDAENILKNTREVLRPGGQVLIVEMLLADDSFAGSLCDLHLLTVTGGRERTVEAYERLLLTAGFALERVCHVAVLPSIITGVAI